jgi:glycerol-3-phosphate dehydrogenase
MSRNFDALDSRVFDVLVIGGGVFGACAAWDATLRGLSVALIERADFCSGVSANSYKFVHGGIRYLQHADLSRLRQSCAERSALLRVAPHLVAPVPVVIPTFARPRQGKALLGAGMLLYDALTLDRNLGIADHGRRIPLTRFLGREAVLELFPSLPRRDLTGAAIFCDGQMYNPTRLVLAFVKSAMEQGAIAVNYAEAEKLVLSDTAVDAVRVRDNVSGEVIEVRARAVLNAAGPWVPWMLADLDRDRRALAGTYSRDACFVVKRKFPHSYALALQGRTRDPDALLSRPARHLFMTPWRQYTLCGVWHRVWAEHPDDVRVTELEIESFISEVNDAMPGLDLSPPDVTMWNAGLVPFGDNEEGASNLRYGKRSHVIDHRAAHGLTNLVSLIGVRYTMARADACRAVDLVCAKLGEKLPRARTHVVPVHGAGFESFDALVAAVTRRIGDAAGAEAATALAHNYGSAYRSVVELAGEPDIGAGCLTGTNVFRAEIAHAVREEMALRLTDIVFRRTELATGGHPGPKALHEAATLAARELGWDERRRREEVASVERRFIIGNDAGFAPPPVSPAGEGDAIAGAGA